MFSIIHKLKGPQGVLFSFGLLVVVATILALAIFDGRGLTKLVKERRTIGTSVLRAPNASLETNIQSRTVQAVAQDRIVHQEIIYFLKLINDYRAQNGAGQLTPTVYLSNAAEWMASDMATYNYFSHTDRLGRDPFVRMCAFGYCYNTWKGENLVAGAQTAQAAFDLWRGSPGHNAVMLSGNFNAIGIGRAYNVNSDYDWYWVTDFGGIIDTPVNYVLDPNSDSDGDGFTNSVEQYLGTDPLKACPATITPNDEAVDAWPADFNDDGYFNIGDINSFLAPNRSSDDGHGTFNKFNHPVPDIGTDGQDHDSLIRRWDLVNNSKIDIGDMNAINPSVNASTARPPMFGGEPAFFAGKCPTTP